MPHMPAEDRRRAFVAAAIEVITREGPARATTRRVAEVAKAPLASLHYAFRDKEELFRAVIERCLDHVGEHYRRHFSAGRGLRQGVRALIQLNMEWASSEPDFHVAEYELFVWALRTPSAAGFARHIYQRWIDQVGLLLAESRDRDHELEVDLTLLARDVVAIIDGMVLQIVAFGAGGPGPADLERLVEAATVSLRPGDRGTSGAAAGG